MEYILSFGSAHKALKAESVLKEAGLSFRLLPAPKSLAAHCDLVISVKDDLPASIEILRKGRAGPKAIYRKEGEDYVKV